MTQAILAARRLKAAERAARRKAKATIPPRWTLVTLKAKLKTELHAAIRERDGARCISCEKSPLAHEDWNAGHLFAVGPFPAVRFHPLNIASQCVGCNKYRGGNHAHYSIEFVRRHGIQALTALGELARSPRKWTVWQLYELLTVLRRDGLAGYQERYFALTGWTKE